MTARYIVGDSLTVLRSLPDNSVDLVLSSPPFLALRSYLPADHPNKTMEIGSEPTPGEFIDTLLGITEECRRVLAPHGSLCFELGDTYSGSGGSGGDYADDGLRAGQEKFDGSSRRGRLATYQDARGNPDGMRDTTFSGGNTRSGSGPGWPQGKSLCLIPESFRWALAYGRNPFTGRTTPTWRVRNVVRWHRPNPPVGALGDKFRPATSEMVVACTARDRYFDLDAVRTINNPDRMEECDSGSRRTMPSGLGNRSTGHTDGTQNPAGAPPLDTWIIPTQPYTGSHYATWPEQLCVRPIKAMCPLKVCTTCGQPSRRIVDVFTLDSYRQSDRPQTVKAVALADAAGLTDQHIAAIRAFGTSDAGKATVLNNGAGRNGADVQQLAAEAKTVLGGYFREFVQTTTASRSSSWTDCGHDTWRTGVVLDPFAGSGTTGLVATGHGRDFIGIDLDERNAELAVERIGPLYLTVEHHNQQGAA